MDINNYIYGNYQINPNYQNSLNHPGYQNNQISFRCVYQVDDINKDIRLINDRLFGTVNHEILAKIKILNGNKKENLIFHKKFDKTGIHTIDFIIERKIYNMSFLFSECSSLKQVEFISCDTSNVIFMIAMFRKCIELEYVDLSVFITSKVIDMNAIFSECRKLKFINGLQNFNTANVINMHGIFQLCQELEYLDLSNFNTSNAQLMMFMFSQCIKLKEIKGIENFNTINCIYMNSMFQGCLELEYLDLSKFNTSKVKDMGWMFNECHKLKEIKGIILLMLII